MYSFVASVFLHENELICFFHPMILMLLTFDWLKNIFLQIRLCKQKKSLCHDQSEVVDPTARRGMNLNIELFLDTIGITTVRFVSVTL